MRYDYLTFRKQCPHVIQRALQLGKLSANRLTIELPDNFDFQSETKPTPVMRGMGDLIARVAQPIAKVIDKVAGTNIKECGGCKRRREKLNELLPL